MDWTVTLDGLLTGVGMLLAFGAAFVIVRRDVAELKIDVHGIRKSIEEIPITLGRHDERIKALETRQNVRINRERRDGIT